MSTRLPQLINGEFQQSRTDTWIPVTNPATQEVLCEVPAATAEEMESAIQSARKAFLEWRETPVSERARVMLRYQHLLKEHHDEIAEVLAKETGKVFADAKGDVWRGIEVVEHAANIGSLMMGETVENVARGIDGHAWTQPLGVCAGITPFNFPAMIPLWMFPMAIACGNSFVLKPSEQDPMTPNILAELFLRAGAPKNLLQVVHGGKEQVDTLLTHPEIKAVSFVGSVPVGQHVYRTATDHLKRAQCFAGAKNHMVVMPDARKDQVISNLVGASCGAAGQRCMAISVAVFVGESKQWIDELKDELAKIRPGAWDDENAAYGPQISPKARDRVLTLIKQGKEEGASCLLDGSDCTVDGLPDGNWVGPTLFSDVTPDMALYKEEIFGPVLSVVRSQDFDNAVQIINDHEFGNGVSIFTRDGDAAREFTNRIQVGMVGANVPIPVPMAFHSFGGWKSSLFGDIHMHGPEGVRFYTRQKAITSRWPTGIRSGAEFTMPTMK